jgi:hypothetical protein
VENDSLPMARSRAAASVNQSRGNIQQDGKLTPRARPAAACDKDNITEIMVIAAFSAVRPSVAPTATTVIATSLCFKAKRDGSARTPHPLSNRLSKGGCDHLNPGQLAIK